MEPLAWITNHLRNGFFIFRPGEGYEYVMILTFCGLMFGATGGGQWSVDHAAGIFDPPGWITVVVCYALGIGGALLLLLASWRPGSRPAKAPKAAAVTCSPAPLGPGRHESASAAAREPLARTGR